MISRFMTRLYRKSELSFACLCLAVYVAGSGLSGALGGLAGLPRLFPALFRLALAVFLLAWVRRGGLCEKFGLFWPRYRLSRACFFLPLGLAACFPLFFCPALPPSAGAALTAVSLACAGFLEELLFRGFLFRALERGGPRRAVMVSSLIFALAHLINLFSGCSPAETALQVVFAAGVGIALAVLVYKGASLLPCVAFHVLNNVLSLFAAPDPRVLLLPLAVCLLVLAVYSFWLLKRLKA
jgi:hypothetical protein